MVARTYPSLYAYIEAELPLLHEKLTQIRLDNPAFNNYHSYRAMVRLRCYIGYPHEISRDGEPVDDLKAMETWLEKQQ